MKRLRVILLLTPFAVLIVLSLWWQDVKKQRKICDSFTERPDVVTVTQAALSSVQAQTLSNVVSAGTAERLRKLRDDPDWDFKQEIRFYGKVIDEAGVPVSGATARFSWSTSRGEGLEFTAVTDINGFFSLTGAWGKQIQVRVSKGGYYSPLRQNQIGFEYAEPSEPTFYAPDPDQPVVFRLKQKGAGAELITSQYGVRPSLGVTPPTNGVPVFVDFFTRKVSATGQLEIRAWKEPKHFGTGRNNWGLRLSIPDGGLLEHDEEFLFEAPEDGYRPTLEWRFAKDSPDWCTGIIKTFTSSSAVRHGMVA